MQDLVLTLSGDDKPGVTAGLTSALSDFDVTVRQLEQIVLQGHLVLGLVLQGSATALDAALIAAGEYAAQRSMGLSSRLIPDADLEHWRTRLIVTVMGSPLEPSDVAAITSTVAAAGGNIDRIRQVAHVPVTAIEFEVGGVEKSSLRSQLAVVARANGIDIAVQESGLDRRGTHLVVMDVDSTFIQEEVIDLLAAQAGVQNEVAEITHRAMNGEMDFEQSLRARVKMLDGLSESALTDVQAKITLTPGARTLTRTLAKIGFHSALVSGGFIEVVGPLAQRLGVHDVRANQLEIVDGRLTGEVLGKVIDRKAKADALVEFAAMHEIPLSRTIAIGDGANDLDMLHTAALGIAFNAKPYVRDLADASVTTPYLDTILYVMGIPREHIEQSDAADGIKDRPGSELRHQRG